MLETMKVYKFTFLKIYLKLTQFLSGKVQLIMIIPIHPLLLATNIWRPLLEGYFSSCQPSLQLNKVFITEQFSAVRRALKCLFLSTSYEGTCWK